MSSLFIVRVLLGQTIGDSSKWLPWSKPPLRYRYGYHGVTPHLHVIAIYRTGVYCRLDIATWQLRDHDTFIFIVRVLLSQTIVDSSYVCGCHGVTPTPMSSLFIVRVLFSQTIDDSSYVYVVAME